MHKRKLLPSFLLLLIAGGAYGQKTIRELIETPLHTTEKETVAFLVQVTEKKEHVAYKDGAYRSYSLEGPFFHIEYKIEKDTCVMAGIRFNQNHGYQQLVREVFLYTRPFGQNRIKEAAGMKIIYTLNTAEKVVTAIDFNFALRRAMKSQK